MSNTSIAGRLRKDGIIALTQPRSAKPLSETATWSNAGLNMTTLPEMRDLAHRLLTYEAVAGKTSESKEAETLRVYEKLRQSLGVFAGSAGFQSLASRALALARSEAPSLSAARVSADGSLQGLGEFEPQIDIDKDRAGEYPAGEGGIILIARLLGLLLILLGETLTLSLLLNGWPGAAFDDRNSGNRRKA
jgi:hypothetical protein